MLVSSNCNGYLYLEFRKSNFRFQARTVELVKISERIMSSGFEFHSTANTTTY